MADDIKVTIKDNINYNLLNNLVKDALFETINETLNTIEDRSKILVPKDTLYLLNSEIKEIETTSNEIKGRISYNTVYAAKQHEDLSLRHKSGESAEYLSRPADEEVQRLPNKLKTKLGG